MKMQSSLTRANDLVCVKGQDIGGGVVSGCKIMADQPQAAHEAQAAGRRMFGVVRNLD